LTGVRVEFLGSGDAFGSGGRLQTCIYVQSESFRLLLDCGASSLIALKRGGIDPVLIDAILVTHLHGDHFGGIPFLILDAQFLSRRTRPLVVAGPPGLETRLRAAMEVLFPGSSQTRQRFDVRVIEMPELQPTRIDQVAVTPHRVAHESGAPSYGLRVEIDGKVVAYSGDSEWTDSLVALAANADFYICECYTFDRPVKFHLSFRTLMQHRNELACGRLVLTHASLDLLDHLSEVRLEVAADGTVIEL